MSTNKKNTNSSAFKEEKLQETQTKIESSILIKTKLIKNILPLSPNHREKRCRTSTELTPNDDDDEQHHETNAEPRHLCE